MQSILSMANTIASYLSDYGAVVQCAPDIEVRTLKTTQTIVMPVGRDRGLETRGACIGNATIDVGVIAKVTFRDGNATEIPGLLTQMENIGKMLLGHNFNTFIVKKLEWNPLYDFDQLRTKSVFVGVIELTVMDLSSDT